MSQNPEIAVEVVSREDISPMSQSPETAVEVVDRENISQNPGPVNGGFTGSSPTEGV